MHFMHTKTLLVCLLKYRVVFFRINYNNYALHFCNESIVVDHDNYLENHDNNITTYSWVFCSVCKTDLGKQSHYNVQPVFMFSSTNQDFTSSTTLSPHIGSNTVALDSIIGCDLLYYPVLCNIWDAGLGTFSGLRS